ncbi:MAG: [NiFe]-hydrogenase assembly chaperone HybE [Zoogloeaceae bacterium]|jgi:[NiFe] hydrogenase assembly HybE family chaperone|nr:[NiFe]-hydrogenase assembly chaperone HybE [Zoogloeaceae bacterium]
MQTVLHSQNPERSLTRVFRRVAANGMADMPFGNPALVVEAVGFRRTENGRWLGVLITPWAVNLLLLPAARARAPWPETVAGGTQLWRFPSGAYEFIAAAGEELGVYHFCSLFSPPHQFASQEAARQTASAVLSGLFIPAAEHADGKSRRAFLGLA